jgi:ABC-type sugar transport system ATPase subunit
MGRSGTGKSVTLLLMGLLKPESGRIYVNDGSSQP